MLVLLEYDKGIKDLHKLLFDSFNKYFQNITLVQELKAKYLQSLGEMDLIQKEILDILDKLNIHIKSQVSKEKLLEFMNNKIKIFHFAGHAIFDEENPQFSKMVLRDSTSLIPLDFVNYSFSMNPLFIFKSSAGSEVKKSKKHPVRLIESRHTKPVIIVRQALCREIILSSQLINVF